MEVHGLETEKTYFGIDLVILEIILLKPDMCFCSLNIYVYIFSVLCFIQNIICLHS